MDKTSEFMHVDLIAETRSKCDLCMCSIMIDILQSEKHFMLIPGPL